MLLESETLLCRGAEGFGEVFFHAASSIRFIDIVRSFRELRLKGSDGMGRLSLAVSLAVRPH